MDPPEDKSRAVSIDPLISVEASWSVSPTKKTTCSFRLRISNTLLDGN